jgi:hypothetical protein
MYWKAQEERVKNALKTIDEFARDTSQPQFPGISRASVVEGLKERVAKPSTLDQNQASLCGPAAYLYCLLNCQPDWFCKYVSDLYNKGYSRIHHLVVKPSADCRNYTPPKSKIADVDWIALASLRDSENSFFDYQDADDTASGATRPGLLAQWFAKGGFGSVQNNTNFVFSKGLPTLLDAMQKMRLGHYVCLFVNDNLLDANEFKTNTYHANHWVVLDGLFNQVVDSDIRFPVYTWGDIHSIPRGNRKMTRDDLSKNFYGYVSGIPDYGAQLA